MKKGFYIVAVCVCTFIFLGFCILENPPFKSEKQYAINSNEYFKEASDKININTAVIEELCLLKGIGPAKAQSIIDYRIVNGKFLDINDLLLVKGITEKMFNEFKDLICI